MPAAPGAAAHGWISPSGDGPAALPQLVSAEKPGWACCEPAEPRGAHQHSPGAAAGEGRAFPPSRTHSPAPSAAAAPAQPAAPSQAGGHPVGPCPGAAGCTAEGSAAGEGQEAGGSPCGGSCLGKKGGLCWGEGC